MDSLWQDVKFGTRTLLKDRSFFVTAALALGIGSTTAIFSVIDNVLLEPFPYRDAQRLVTVNIHDSSRSEPWGRSAFPAPEFLDFQQQNQVFEGAIGAAQDTVLWSSGESIEAFRGAGVTGNTFNFLGVNPLLGRFGTEDDARPGAPPVFVLSYKVWRKRFHEDPSIVGKQFTLDGVSRTLVGVMPKRFAWYGADLWIPKPVEHSSDDSNGNWYFLLGRLKPGLTPESAKPNIALLAQRLSKIYPKNYPKRFDVRLVDLADEVVGKFRETLYTLLAAVGLLLLIACANVANLLLAKSTSREKEFAIRTSLGAGQWKMLRQLLVESLLLALAGAAGGCLLAWSGLKALVAALPRYTFPDEAQISLNLRVLAVTALVAVVTSVLFGLAPALSTLSQNVSESLKAGGRGNSGFRSGRMRNSLVVCEVALSLILLSGAGLMMRDFIAQRTADLGMQSPEKLVVTDVGLPKQYKTADQQARFVRDLRGKMQGVPGVRSVAAAIDFPPFGGIRTDFEIAGKPHSDTWKGQMGFVDDQFFQTVGMRVLRGRLLSEADIADKRKVVVANQALVQKYFPGEDPIGKQIRLSFLENAPLPVANPWFEIVGVGSNLKNHGVQDAVEPQVYAPLTSTGFGEYIVYVRAIGSPGPLVKLLDSTIYGMDKSVKAQNTATMEVSLDENAYAKPRFGLQIFAVFAVIGLVLVSVGVYSVVSYTVTQQNREIGIRMALGASRKSVLQLIMVSGMRFILIGLAVGLV